MQRGKNVFLSAICNSLKRLLHSNIILFPVIILTNALLPSTFINSANIHCVEETSRQVLLGSGNVDYSHGNVYGNGILTGDFYINYISSGV